MQATTTLIEINRTYRLGRRQYVCHPISFLNVEGKRRALLDRLMWLDDGRHLLLLVELPTVEDILDGRGNDHDMLLAVADGALRRMDKDAFDRMVDDPDGAIGQMTGLSINDLEPVADEPRI